MQFNPKP